MVPISYYMVNPHIHGTRYRVSESHN